MGRAYVDLLGHPPFDQLTVVERAFVQGSRNALWRCKCTCGSYVVVSSRSLRSGHTTSCGCKRKTVTRENQKRSVLKLFASKTDLEWAVNRMFTEYRGSARKRNRAFDLSIEDFTTLVREGCHYCGTSPFTGFTPRSSRRVKVLLNGVDRVDSKQGYVHGNVVPCCKHCNKAKLDRTEDDFVQHCTLVVIHQQKKRDQDAKRA